MAETYLFAVLNELSVTTITDVFTATTGKTAITLSISAALTASLTHNEVSVSNIDLMIQQTPSSTQEFLLRNAVVANNGGFAMTHRIVIPGGGKLQARRSFGTSPVDIYVSYLEL